MLGQRAADGGPDSGTASPPSLSQNDLKGTSEPEGEGRE